MASGRMFDEWNMETTDWKLAVARYLRTDWKADNACWPSDGAKNSYDDKEVFARAHRAAQDLRDKFTKEEWDLIYSDEPVEVLDKW